MPPSNAKRFQDPSPGVESHNARYSGHCGMRCGSEPEPRPVPGPHAAAAAGQQCGTAPAPYAYSKGLWSFQRNSGCCIHTTGARQSGRRKPYKCHFTTVRTKPVVSHSVFVPFAQSVFASREQLSPTSRESNERSPNRH